MLGTDFGIAHKDYFFPFVNSLKNATAREFFLFPFLFHLVLLTKK